MHREPRDNRRDISSGPSHADRSLPNTRSYHHISQAARPRQARDRVCWNLHAAAVARFFPAFAPDRSSIWCCILTPSALGNLALYRLGEPVIHWRHILARHTNVHVVVVILRRRFRHSGFGLGNHRIFDGLIATSSRGGKRRGHYSSWLRVC